MVARVLSVLLFTLTVSACARSVPKTPALPVPADFLVTMERTICSGTCPNYRLTIDSSGQYTYEGLEFVKVKGVVKGVLDAEKMQSLLAAMNSSSFFALGDYYDNSQDGCPEFWADFANVLITITADGQTKSIYHYQGCQDKEDRIYPRGLGELEATIDMLLETRQLVK